MHLFIKKLVLLSLVAFVFGQNNVALITKVRGEIFHKAHDSDEYASAVKSGTQLKNKDWIKTGADGYIAIFFLDDKSQLKIKQDTEIQILGSEERGKINKTISLDYGQVKAKVEKQKGEFKIVTPTSVASVKGTEFWMISEDGVDQIIGIQGVVEVENRFSGGVVQVTTNQTANSTPDGGLDTEETEGADIPDDPDDDTDDDAGNTNLHQLRIKLQNSSNEERFIIIEYSE